MTKQFQWLFGAALMLLVSCGDTAVKKDEPKEELKEEGNSTWETFETAGYSIEYPGTWNVDASGHMGTKFVISSPASSQSDVFSENVNLLIQPIGDTIDLEEFHDVTMKELARMVGEDNIILDKFDDTKGKDFYKVSYYMAQSRLDLRINQRYWVKDGSAYILTFAALVSIYDNVAEEADKMMASFVIKD